MKLRSRLPREFSTRTRKKILPLFSLYEFTYCWHNSLLVSCFWSQGSEGREGTGGGGLLNLGHSLAIAWSISRVMFTDWQENIPGPSICWFGISFWHQWFISRWYEIDSRVKLIFTNRLYEIALKLQFPPRWHTVSLMWPLQFYSDPTLTKENSIWKKKKRRLF